MSVKTIPWTFVPFEELFAVPLKNGVSYPSRLRGVGIPMVNMKEIFAFDEILDQECELAPLTESEMAQYTLVEGDLLFARQSLTFEGAGRCVLVGPGSRPRTWESHIIRVRLDLSRAVPRFYYCYFRSPQGRQLVESIVQQVAAAGVRGSDLRRLAVPVPPIAEQKAIAEVLGALDDKIAANRNLADVAQSLLAAKFSALQLDEDYGDQIRVDAYFELNPKCAKPQACEPTYLDMQKLPTSDILVSDWDQRPAKSGTRFMNGDTLLARITPCLENRKVGYVDFLDDGEVGLGSTEYIVFRARPGVPKELAFFLVTSSRFRATAMQHMVGTSGRQRLSAADVAGFTLRKIEDSKLAEWGGEAAPLVKHLGSLRDENRTLASLREALLPRLMSGELRVRDGEKLVEDLV